MPTPARSPVPSGMPTVTAHLWFRGNCRAAIGLYRRIFDAEEVVSPVSAPDGTILHAMLRIGDSPVVLADSWPRSWEVAPGRGTTVTLWLYVPDCDAVFERAAAAGCEVMLPLAEAFWGDRFGKFKDPFGHAWAVATRTLELSPEELAERQAAWLRTI